MPILDKLHKKNTTLTDQTKINPQIGSGRIQVYLLGIS